MNRTANHGTTARIALALVLAAVGLTCKAGKKVGTPQVDRGFCADSCPKDCHSDNDCDTTKGDLCCEYPGVGATCQSAMTCPRICQSDNMCKSDQACVRFSLDTDSKRCDLPRNAVRTCGNDQDCPSGDKCCGIYSEPVCLPLDHCPTTCASSADCDTSQGQICCTTLGAVDHALGNTGLCIDPKAVACPRVCQQSSECRTQDGEICCDGICSTSCAHKTCQSSNDCQGQICCLSAVANLALTAPQGIPVPQPNGGGGNGNGDGTGGVPGVTGTGGIMGGGDGTGGMIGGTGTGGGIIIVIGTGGMIGPAGTGGGPIGTGGAGLTPGIGGMFGTGGAGVVGTGGAGAGTCGLVIDDMESGTGYTCTGDGRNGYWFSYADASSTFHPTPNLYPCTPSLLPTPRGNSTRGMHLYGTVSQYAGAGLYLDYATKAYNASGYTGIQFYAMGTATSLSMIFQTTATEQTVYGGTCTLGLAGCTGNKVDLSGWAADTWSQFRIPFSSAAGGVAPFSPTSIWSIEWEQLGAGALDMWIDDVSFY